VPDTCNVPASIVETVHHCRSPTGRYQNRRGRAAARRVALLGEQGSAPGTRIFLADIFELCRERMDALFDQTLDVLEDAMKARQFLVVNRVLVDVGPDHYARLEAVKMFTVLMIHASKRTP